MKDSVGNAVDLSTMGSGMPASDTQAGGVPDFWIRSRRPMGEVCTLLDTPDVDSPDRFKFEFRPDDKHGTRERVPFQKMP